MCLSVFVAKESELTMLKPNEVKTSNIATYAVTTSKIAKSAVTTDKIADGAVSSAKLQEDCVTTNKISDLAITNDKIANRTITQDKLVLPIVPPSPLIRPISPQVETDEIKDGAIVRAKIAVNAVESDNIKDLNVTSGKLASSAVTNAKIADNAITASKIASNAIGSSEIAANAVGTSEIANGAVTAEKLAPGAGGGSRITFLPTRIQMTSLIVGGNQDWMPTAPNPSIPDTATALILQVELVQQSIAPPPQGWLNCRFRRDATQQECFAIGVEAKNVGQVYGGQVIVPITGGSFQYSFTDASGNVSVTFNPYVVGYIV